MDKREAELKSAFMKVLSATMPSAMFLTYATAGAPDKEVVDFGRTTRWEFKHGTPDFESPGIQELCCMRLAAVGHCRYVIWQETYEGTCPRTMIVHPREVHNRGGYRVTPESFCSGYDMKWLANKVRELHKI